MYYSTLPAYSKICGLMDEMDHSSLQPQFTMEDQTESDNTCARGDYTSDDLDIQEIMYEYNTESEMAIQGNCYQNSTGSRPNNHLWNYYHQLPQRNINISTCAPPNTTIPIAHGCYGPSAYGTITDASSKQDTNCCGSYQNKSNDFDRNPGGASQFCGQYLHTTHPDKTDQDFSKWSAISPEKWNSKQVLDWLFELAEKHQLDFALLHGENFRGVSGSDLCSMGMEDFQQMEPNFGRFFYELFRKLLDGLNFKPRIDTSTAINESTDADDSCPSLLTVSSSPPHFKVEHVSRSFDNLPDYQSYNNLGKVEIQESVFYEQQQQQQQYTCPRLPLPHHMQARHSFPGATAPVCNVNERPCMYQSYCTAPQGINQCTMSCDLTSQPIPRRRPGRPRIKSLPTEEEAQKEKKAKIQHLWEFIYEILMNPLYNPQFLRWENRSEGIFRFVQSEAVAQLWGSLKNNENMTYEKLSRAMRHYYKRGILERVEGRRLVYKFTNLAMEKVREKRLSV